MRIGHRAAAFLALVTVAAVLSQPAAVAAAGPAGPSQGESGGPQTPSTPDGGLHRKGSMELAGTVGFGDSHHLWGGIDHARIFSFGMRFGRVISEPRGPGFLRGNLEVGGEVVPLLIADYQGRRYGASVTFLSRHFFRPSSTLRPYAVVGFGAASTTHPLPAGSRALNFTPQAGMGVTFSDGGQAFYAEYHILHMSAGHYPQGINPGINSSYLVFGVSVYRWGANRAPIRPS